MPTLELALKPHKKDEATPPIKPAQDNSPATSSHIINWNGKNYRIHLEEVSVRSGSKQLLLNHNQWNQFDSIMLQTLEKVSSVSNGVFQSGIPFFAIESSLQEMKVSYQEKDEKDKTPKTLELKDRQKTAAWSKEFFESVCHLGPTYGKSTIPATPIHPAPASPIKQTPATPAPALPIKQTPATPTAPTPDSSEENDEISIRGSSFQDHCKFCTAELKSRKQLSGQNVIFAAHALQIYHHATGLVISREQKQPVEIRFDQTACIMDPLTSDQKQKINPPEQNVYIPLRSPNAFHFTLLYRTKGQWHYYDSLLQNKNKVSESQMNAMKKFLQLGVFQSIQIDIPSSDNSDQQANSDGTNCGAYVLRKIESLMFPSLKKDNIEQYRKALAKQINDQYSDQGLLKSLLKLGSPLPANSFTKVSEPQFPSSSPKNPHSQSNASINIFAGPSVDVISHLNPHEEQVICCNWNTTPTKVDPLMTCSQLGLSTPDQYIGAVAQPVLLLRDRFDYYRQIQAKEKPQFAVHSINIKEIAGDSFNENGILNDEELKKNIYFFLKHAITQNYDTLVIPEFPLSSNLTPKQRESARQAIANIYKEMLIKLFPYFNGRIYLTSNESSDDTRANQTKLFNLLKGKGNEPVEPTLSFTQLSTLTSDFRKDQIQFRDEAQLFQSFEEIDRPSLTPDQLKVRRLNQEMAAQE